MRSFEQRLITYRGWPHHFLRAEKLAHAGFRYTKESDLVQCDTCGVQIGDWCSGDDPIIEHKKWSPGCRYLKNLLGATVAEDTCGMYGIQRKEKPQEGASLVGPRYSMFTTKEERLKTFRDWPKSLKQKPDELAEAGFFYMNVGDKTVCFYCGVGCKDWEENDVPWEEHAKWSPSCEYLRLHKGEQFISLFKLKEVAAAEPQEEKVSNEKNEKDEEQKTDNKAICKVCYDREIAVVFYPCGHTACLECAPVFTKCHICRTPIDRFIRIYMA